MTEIKVLNLGDLAQDPKMAIPEKVLAVVLAKMGGSGRSAGTSAGRLF